MNWLNDKRFNDIKKLEILTISNKNDITTIQYPLSTKLPLSFGIPGWDIDNIRIRGLKIDILLVKYNWKVRNIYFKLKNGQKESLISDV